MVTFSPFQREAHAAAMEARRAYHAGLLVLE